MALFPFFRNLEGQLGIIVGGGKHALEKVERLQPFGPRLQVIAPEFCPGLQQYGESDRSAVSEQDAITGQMAQVPVSLMCREFEEQDLDSKPAFVIVAGEVREKGSHEAAAEKISGRNRDETAPDRAGEESRNEAAAEKVQEENRRIAGWCRERGIPVNVVDDQEYCDFIFPSLITRGSLSVGICTNGASPSVGVLLKRKIEEQIPEHMEEILDFLQEKRPAIKEAIEDKKKRFAFYYKLAEWCMEQDRTLTEEEFADLFSTM